MDVVVWVVLIVLAISVISVMALAIINLLGLAVGNRREPVVLEYELRQGEADSLGVVLDQVLPVMRSARYELGWENSTLACFARTYRPLWRIVLAIFFLPLGLLLLLWTSTESVVLQVLARGMSPRLYVSGRLGHRDHEALRAALAGLGEEHPPAGWYPATSGEERYWDGDHWTDQTRPAQVVVGPRMTSVPPS
jgi:hypothetical protein